MLKVFFFPERNGVWRGRCIKFGFLERLFPNHYKSAAINLKSSKNCVDSVSNLRVNKQFRKNYKKVKVNDRKANNSAKWSCSSHRSGMDFSYIKFSRHQKMSAKHCYIRRHMLLDMPSRYWINIYLSLNEETTLILNKSEIRRFSKVEDKLWKNFKAATWSSVYQRKQHCANLQEKIRLSINTQRLFSTSSSYDCNNVSNVNKHNRFPSNNSPVTEDKLYKAPKNVLHNAYDILAQQLANIDFKLQPTYNIIKNKNNNHSWCCTYHVKWPEPMKFVAVGQTKREASDKAAMSALLWLRKNGKINKDGYPIIIGKDEIREIVKKTQPTITLDYYTVDQMNIIKKIYKNEFVPLLTANFDRSNSNTLDNDKMSNNEFNMSRNSQKKTFSSLRYMAKEKISLPISQYKEEFMNLLAANRVIIIKGEPGCGKSTRIPQYVLEAWSREGLSKGESCCIAVTQPRRIAAVSLADRVSHERDEHCGQIVGYQIRLKSNFNPVTGRILYCTTGILLQHLQTDVSLSNFSHVILDEAHERDVNTDLLMNLIRNALSTNPKLKLIVMSATIDMNLFKNYLSEASIMHIPGFTYPVKSYFLEDLNELDLTKTYKVSSDNNEMLSVVHEDVVKLIKHIHAKKAEGAILCFLPGWEDIAKIEKLIPVSNDMTVFCLHSRLQDSDQRKIFSKTSPGVRKVILSTNIAETSITIDDVVYVIDTGIHKENRFDNEKGVNCIDNYWISQSSMAQRKGRAGRVQPGESFHLYTKAKFETFPQFTDPEILKTSLTKILLNSKVYSNNMDALEFMSQLPSPPDKNATRRAARELKELKLLDDYENLTSLGRTLANFQLEPKLAKILVNAVIFKCVTPVVDIVTIFSADTELFKSGLVGKENIKKIKSGGSKHSDHLAMMRLFEEWLELLEERGSVTAERYCTDASLVHHKLLTLNKLRKIHFNYIHNELHQTLPVADIYSDNDELVKAILFSGVGTLLKHQNFEIVKGRYIKRNVFLTNYNQKATITSESVNFKRDSFSSNFLVYFNETRSNIRRTTLIRECSVIAPIAVMLFSNKDLVIEEVEGQEDTVILSLKDTKTEFMLSKGDAHCIQECKKALDSAYWYFIFQMTQGGEYNGQINEVWDKILEHLHIILLKNSIS